MPFNPSFHFKKAARLSLYIVQTDYSWVFCFQLSLIFRIFVLSMWFYVNIPVRFNTSTFLIEVPVPIQKSERSCIFVLGVFYLTSLYDFDIRFWNCSDTMVLFVFPYPKAVFVSSLNTVLFILYL